MGFIQKCYYQTLCTYIRAGLVDWQTRVKLEY
jgi:hypothetical protein